MKKLLLTAVMVLGFGSLAFAQSAPKVGWDSYPTVDASVTTIRIYGLKAPAQTVLNGTPGVILLATIPSTNTSFTLNNLSSGPWNFVATAVSTNGPLESIYSNTASTNVIPGAVINFRFVP